MGEATPPDTDEEIEIHRAVSDDGTEIVGRVHGTGPPVVLLPAGPGDSETSWGVLLPILSERFTCYLMDTRSRGLSDQSSDLSPERLVEDVVAFAESIGEPVGLVGWGSPLWARVAAQNTTAISSVVAYEPGVFEVMSEEDATRFEGVVERVGELVSEGRLANAAQAFIENSGFVYTDEDLASGAPADFWDAAAPNIPVFLQEEQQAAESERPSSTASSVLQRITVPVLLLYGNQTKPWFRDSVRYVAEHVADTHVREIGGAAHYGPHTEPEAVADELVPFFERHQGKR